MFHPLPQGLSFFHPVALISTWFGSGLLRPASGSWGSLAALPFAAAIAWAIHPLALIPAAGLLLALGIWASGIFAARLGKDDPSPVVVDEVVGQWLTLAVVPLDPVLYAAGFFLFRALDVLKPWPARWADSKLSGGLGIMLDDVFAGLYGALGLWALDRWVI